MTRILLAVLLLAVCTTTAAAQIEVPAADFQNQKSPLKKSTRIAVVNVAFVMDRYDKIIQLKKDVHIARAPFNQEMQSHRGNIAKWQKSIDEREVSGAQKSELETKIETAQSELKKLASDSDAAADKVQGDRMPRLWKDMLGAIKTVASESKIDIVLGHGDLVEEKARNLPPTAANTFPAINRKMQAMDAGSSVPLHVNAKVDATNRVIELLNQPASAKADLGKIAGAESVSLVNIGYVFNRYARAIQFKSDLEAAFQPYKVKAKMLSDERAECERAIRTSDFTMGTLDQLQTRIALAKKQLEELSAEMQRELGKKQESNLVQLWKEVNRGIQNYADRAGIDLVLGFGDPLDKAMMDLFPNINRKMQAMDSGSVVPLFASPKSDIAEPLTEWLNKQLTKDKDQAGPDGPNPGKFIRSYVAVENVGYVFNNYTRAQHFKKELEEGFAPFKASAAKITKEIGAWETALKSEELNAESKDVLQKKIRLAKRKLEDLSIDLQRTLGSKQEDNLKTLWKEVQLGNKLVAIHYQIDLLLGFGDPLDEKTCDSLSNMQRKLTAMDGGGVAPLFLSPAVDLGPAATGTLNRWVSELEKEKSER